jgi:NitT/TauT family transport system permease protein
MSATTFTDRPAGKPRRASLVRRGLAAGPAIGVFVVFIAVWEIYVRYAGVSSLVLPGPSEIFTSLTEDWRVYRPHAIVTLRESVIGFALASVVAMALATMITSSRALRLAIYPFMLASQAVPIIAVAPLMILWFGFGETSKILAAAFVAFFPIAVNAAAGLSSLDPGAVTLMRSFPASRRDIFLRARLPNALPQIFSGLRIGAVLSVIGAIVGEFVGADQGLGMLLARANSSLQPTTVFGCIVWLSIMGMAIFGLVALLEWLLMPWRRATKQ